LSRAAGAVKRVAILTATTASDAAYWAAHNAEIEEAEWQREEELIARRNAALGGIGECPGQEQQQQPPQPHQPSQNAAGHRRRELHRIEETVEAAEETLRIRLAAAHAAAVGRQSYHRQDVAVFTDSPTHSDVQYVLNTAHEPTLPPVPHAVFRMDAEDDDDEVDAAGAGAGGRVAIRKTRVERPHRGYIC